MTWTWRAWQAFERDKKRDNTTLWRELAKSCRGDDGRTDVDELSRWQEVFTWHRRGDT